METIKIKYEILSKIFAYAEACELEVSGWGVFNNKRKIIDKIFPLYEQYCSAVDTEHDMINVNRMANFHWHSHVNMGTFWSSQDESTIENIGKYIPTLISLVVNKRKEYKCRVDIFSPIRLTQECGLDLFTKQYPNIEKIQKEVKEKVKEREYTVENKSGEGNYYLFEEEESKRNKFYSLLSKLGYKKINGIIRRGSSDDYLS